MNELWLYQVLDIIGTLIESFGMYILVGAFCPNVKKKIINIIPPIVCLVTTFIFTWFIDLPFLKELHIDNTNFMDTSNLENLTNLQRIGISEEQYIEGKKFYKELIQKGVLVLNQNLLEFDERSALNESV